MVDERKLDRVKQKLEDAKDRIRDLEKKVEHRIQEHPMQSVAVAFGAGVIIGSVVCALARRR